MNYIWYQLLQKITPEIQDGRLMVEAIFRKIKRKAKDYVSGEVALSIRLINTNQVK